jgi:prepilin-type N-terminal cleavage/methylation domain-containing protein
VTRSRGRRSRSRSRSRSRIRQAGFTLIELLVTLSITTIGLVGLLGLHLSLERSNDEASRDADANAIGGRTLEGLRSARIPDMLTALGLPTGSVPPQTVTMSTMAGRSGMTYRRTAKLAAITSTLWRVRVEIGWTEDGATAGGTLDHTVATEVLRTTEEAL